MTIQIRKAERRVAKLRLGIAGTSGSGKTYGALKLAFGLGGKIGMIDTENGSGDLYADLGDYDIISISAPYLINKYLDAIKAFEDAGYDVIIIDSLTHAWAGDGGLLDKQGKIADTGKGNTWTAWRSITPEHNALVEKMLTSPAHIIATMRSKQEYVQEKNEHGKSIVTKIGMAPVQREGMDYEFTVMIDVAQNHTAQTSKDRTGLFDGQFFKLSEDTGIQLKRWLYTGKAFDLEKALNDIKASKGIDELAIVFKTHIDEAKRMNESHAIDLIIKAKDDKKAELTDIEAAENEQLSHTGDGFDG